MDDTAKQIGKINWVDLTVPNADEVKSFYEQVAGWQPESFDMGGYNDYVMKPPNSNEGIAGICNLRGSNTGFPSQWLIYINVNDLNESLEACIKLGGKIIIEPKEMPGNGKYSVIQDPAGAVCALFEPI